MRSDSKDHIGYLKNNIITEKIRVYMVVIIKKIIFGAINQAHRLCKDYLLKEDELFDERAKELYRVMSIGMDRDFPGMKDKWAKTRDLLVWFLDFDDAYAIRFADSFSQIDLDKIKVTDKDREKFKAKGELYKIDGL